LIEFPAQDTRGRYMFGFTDGAATLIRSLIRGTDLGEDAALRMTLGPCRRSLAMSLAAHPETPDDVFTRRDVRVFVAPAAAARLDARTLYAQVIDPPPAFFLLDR
jgi:Fe-S cluster assembly iron-binding protein IscA